MQAEALAAASVAQEEGEVVGTTRAMASAINVRVPIRGLEPLDGIAGQRRIAALIIEVGAVLDDLHAFERACTRFQSDSPLAEMNAAPWRWHRGPDQLIEAIGLAYDAYTATKGRFDPRVIDVLLSLGYSVGLDFGDATAVGSDDALPTLLPPRGSWQPRIHPKARMVRLGGRAIDLGGIGKGLAVRNAARLLGRSSNDFLIEAGGDCYCAGLSTDGGAWRIGVEDPFGSPNPVAVLEVSDEAVATSSTRVRHWRVGEEEVHHLIDPVTNRPGGEGLLSVTVVSSDPAWAEVWSKVLFLQGRDGIAALAASEAIRALWVYEDGTLGESGTLGASLMWRRT